MDSISNHLVKSFGGKECKIQIQKLAGVSFRDAGAFTYSTQFFYVMEIL
jgi:hypothetical protein